MNSRKHIKLVRILGAAFCCALLAACSLKKDEPAGPPVVNGNWASTDGVFTAEFLNGRFSATANDTGGVISRGEYVVLAEDRLRLKWEGLVSGTTNEANCTKPTPEQLDCVDLEGKTFSLRRTS